MKILLKKLNPAAILPLHASASAAGYDLFACLDTPLILAPHETARIGTGLAAAIPEGWFGAVFARSGLATKQGLRPANCVGVIDADYRGELQIPLHNDSDEERIISPGDRIAQLVLVPFLSAEFELTSELPDTERGLNGFGSTGKN